MKKRGKRTLVILGIVVALLGGMVLLATVGLQDALNLRLEAVDLSGAADGVYSGAYVSGRWTNHVDVTIRDHAITAVTPTDPAKGREQLAKELSAEVVAEQSPDVDVIAGATASSRSFLKAVETALKVAAE